MVYEGLKEAKEVISMPKKVLEKTKNVVAATGRWASLYNIGDGVARYFEGQARLNPIQMGRGAAQAATGLVDKLGYEIQRGQKNYWKNRAEKAEALLEENGIYADQGLGQRIVGKAADLGKKVDEYKLEDALEDAGQGKEYVVDKSKDVAGAVAKGATELGGKVKGFFGGLRDRIKNRDEEPVDESIDTDVPPKDSDE